MSRRSLQDITRLQASSVSRGSIGAPYKIGRSLRILLTVLVPVSHLRRTGLMEHKSEAVAGYYI